MVLERNWRWVMNREGDGGGDGDDGAHVLTPVMLEAYVWGSRKQTLSLRNLGPTEATKERHKYASKLQQ